MKRIGNKGFTVSTLLYGLLLIALLLVLLIMNNMSNNRANTRQLVKKIDGDLNRFSNSNSEMRPSTTGDDTQEFLVPPERAGWYKIELWAPKKGTNGDYVSGLVYLYSNDSLYINVGSTSTTGKVTVMVNTGEAAASTLMSAGQGNSTMMGYTKTSTVNYAHTTPYPHNGDENRTRVYSVFNGFIAKNVYKEEIGRATVNLVSDAAITAPPGQKSSKLSGTHGSAKFIKVCNAKGAGTLRVVKYKPDGYDTVTDGYKKTKLAVEKVDVNVPATGCSGAADVSAADWMIADIAFIPNANVDADNIQIQYSTTASGTYTSILAGKRTIDTYGLHVTPWDQDETEKNKLESGSYYVIAATNKKAMNDMTGDGIRMDPMSGATSQKWYFQKQGDAADAPYKIINPSNNKVLSLSGGIDFSDPNYWNEIEGDTEIPVQTTQDQENYAAQKWNVQQQNNKTYKITMVLSEGAKSYEGFLFRSKGDFSAEGDLLYTKNAKGSENVSDFIIRKSEY